MKALITFLSFVFSINSFAQNIKGKIFDENKNPLSGVNVYFDGTTIGTISDKNGSFNLRYDTKSNGILAISFVGYQTEYYSSLDLKNELNIKMSLSQSTLKEVVVNRKDRFSREQKLRIFREFFLGKTYNGRRALIQNEEDIHFKYDKENYILKAFSDKPLIIINSSLGYKINYELVSFEVAFKGLSIDSNDVIKNFYAGITRFEETNNSEDVLIRREKAFQGSQIQFFRNLVDNIWGKELFLISNNALAVRTPNCFRITKEEEFAKIEVLEQQPKEEENNKNRIVSYDILFNRTEQSKITFETNTFYIYKYGNNSNINDIFFSGKISEKKVGDMLPLNYAK
jgi:hypothetical protein